MAPADILNFTKSGMFAAVTLVGPVSFSLPNLTQISSLATEIWTRNHIQNGSRRILNFQQRLFWAPDDSRIDNIYLRIKFDAKRPRSDWNALVYVFPRWQPLPPWICFSLFLDHSRSHLQHLGGLYLTANVVVVRSDVTGTLGFWSITRNRSHF